VYRFIGLAPSAHFIFPDYSRETSESIIRLSGTAQPAAPSDGSPAAAACRIISRARFACIEDMGSDNEIHGQIVQRLTERCRNKEIYPVITLGYNCYTAPEHYWNRVSQEPFKNVKCPWYPILGNHDYEGYSKRADRRKYNRHWHHDNKNDSEHSDNDRRKDGKNDHRHWQVQYSSFEPRWRMPHTYYNQTFGNLLEIIIIDTPTLCPVESQALCWGDEDDLFNEADKSVQYRWIEERLAASTAHWKVVCGHYPIYCHGTHEGTKELQKLERLMHANNADVYICGHDHSLQHHYNKERNIHHLVSGSASESTNTGRVRKTRNICGMQQNPDTCTSTQLSSP
jgi:predicted phosphodiesterase